MERRIHKNKKTQVRTKTQIQKSDSQKDLRTTATINKTERNPTALLQLRRSSRLEIVQEHQCSSSSDEASINVSRLPQPELVQEFQSPCPLEEGTYEVPIQSVHNSKSSKGRGPNKCIAILSSLERKPLEFSDLGQPIGNNSVKYSTYIGVIVREKVPITVPTWHNVEPEVKEELWNKVKEKFIIPEYAKSITLKSMGKDWRESKTQKRKLIDIDDNYDQALQKWPEEVPYDQWETFAKQCTSSSYKETRRRHVEARKHHKYTHTCSRLGYPRLEDNMNKAIADDTSSTVKKVRKSAVWKKAHTKKNGEAVNELAQEKIDEIDEIIATNPGSGEDELTKVLGPEAVRFGMSSNLYKNVKQSQEMVENLLGEVKVLKEELIEFHEVKEKISSLEAQIAKLSQSLGNHSCDRIETPYPESTSLALQLSYTPSKPVKCKLFWLIPSEIVATGYYYTSEPTSTVHGEPLGDGMSKVSIQTAVKELTLLVREDGRYKTIGDALGSFVAWPTPFVIKD